VLSVIERKNYNTIHGKDRPMQMNASVNIYVYDEHLKISVKI